MANDKHDSELCSCFLGQIDLHLALAEGEAKGVAICFRGNVEKDREALVVIVPHFGVKEFIAGHEWLERECKRNPQQYARLIGRDRSDN